MLNPSFPHRAFYDDDGNIIIPGFSQTPEPIDEPEPMREQEPAPPPMPFVVEEDVQWIITEDEPAALHALEPAAPRSPRSPLRLHVQEHIVSVRRMTRGAVKEGAKQYKVSINAGKPLLQHAWEDLRRVGGKLWNFLAQPVWVPTRKKEIKQYSRGMLFFFDILRFGSTFTLIFLALFVALNYESFWQIASSKISHVLSNPTIESPGTESDNPIIQALKGSGIGGTDGRERGELLSFLPNVGPPDNRILIPKLNLNVPLVTPRIDSLLRQDWVQVESDIQDSLAHGVVHYPGTAKPGQAGNFFVTGHSSYYPWAPGQYKTIFARLQELNIGDEYWVYFKGDRHRYVVMEKKEVSPSDVTVLDQPENMRISTLMTCTPVGTTLRRLILVAQEVDPITKVALKVGERGEKPETPKLQLEALPI